MTKLKEFTIEVPLHVYVPRKTVQDRRYLLNMNSYRNWQGHESNAIKKAFNDVVSGKLKGIQLQTPVNVEFTLYKGSNRRTDKSNFYSVLSKFLFDSFTVFEVWEDDNDDFIKTEVQNPTEVDKDKPRAVFIFRSINE